MKTEIRTKEKNFTFNLDSDLMKNFEKKVKKENTTMRESLEVMIVNFIERNKKYDNYGVEYASDEEMKVLENNKELLKELKEAQKEIREGKGTIAYE